MSSLAQALRLARQKGRRGERERERARASARVPRHDTVLSTSVLRTHSRTPSRRPRKTWDRMSVMWVGYGQCEIRFGTLRGVAFCRRANPEHPRPAGPRVSEAHASVRPVRKSVGAGVWWWSPPRVLRLAS